MRFAGDLEVVVALIVLDRLAREAADSTVDQAGLIAEVGESLLQLEHQAVRRP